MNSTNTEKNMGMSELPMASAMVSETLRSKGFDNKFELVVIELSTRKHKCTQEENRILWKCYLKSDKNVSGYMGKMHQSLIDRGNKDMTKLKLSGKYWKGNVVV